jgi:glycosyltransferase involved in cell wall biosynthesis
VRRPRALLATPHHWTSPFQVGGHHVARALVAEGWDVAFVSNPISPLHRLAGSTPELAERRRLWRSGGAVDLAGHLWAYVPFALATPRASPILRSERLHRHWHRLTVPDVRRTVAEHGFDRVEVLYVDSVVQAFWLDAIPHARSVQRIGDLMAGFAAFTPAMRLLEAELARRVDLVAYSATALRPHVRGLGARRIHHFPNGVDVDHFVLSDRTPPEDLAGIPRPIAIYVGALDEWFDYASVNAMTAALPGVSFVLIGPPKLARARLDPGPNLHLLGRRPYAEIPRYLHNADVGLIPFDAAGHPDLVASIHPLKLYEYLACGLPVVATRWTEIERLGSPAILCSTPAEHVEGVSAALASRFDSAAAIEFARRADWRLRVRELLAALDLPAGGAA